MKNPTLSALAVIVCSAATSAASAQDVAAGKTSFNKCLACHAIGGGAKAVPIKGDLAVEGGPGLRHAMLVYARRNKMLPC